MTNSRDPNSEDPLAPTGAVGSPRSAPLADAPTPGDAAETAPLESIRGTATEAVEATQASSGATANDEIDPAGTVADPQALHGIAQAVATGVIDTGEARARLIDAVLAAQLPPDIDPATATQLRREVEDLLADDPTLAALLQPSTG